MLDSIECFRDLRVSEISGLLVVVICLPRGRESEGIVFGGRCSGLLGGRGSFGVLSRGK